MRFERRRFLKALGLGALTTMTPFDLAASSKTKPAGGATLAGTSAPTRVVFFVTPHGHTPLGWNMPVSGPTDAFAERSLLPLAPADFSPILQPLHAFRDRLLVVEGLSHTSALEDIADVMKSSGDLNNHSVGVANVLTGTRAMQISGSPCTGGARSIDQELALRTIGPGRFGSRVYGFDYVPNQTVAPFSFLGPGQATPVVADPATAFADLTGQSSPSANPASREARIAAMRSSVLDSVAREYELLAPRLDADGRRRLDDHRDLVRQLETTIGPTAPPTCDATFSQSGTATDQLLQLVRLGLACDLTRVATFIAQVPQTSEIGYPASDTVHGYAHQSIEGATSCGTTYSPLAAQAMIDVGIWYAKYFASLLASPRSTASPKATGRSSITRSSCG